VPSYVRERCDKKQSIHNVFPMKCSGPSFLKIFVRLLIHVACASTCRNSTAQYERIQREERESFKRMERKNKGQLTSYFPFGKEVHNPRIQHASDDQQTYSPEKQRAYHHDVDTQLSYKHDQARLQLAEAQLMTAQPNPFPPPRKPTPRSRIPRFSEFRNEGPAPELVRSFELNFELLLLVKSASIDSLMNS
jgi:hypothetical protein